MYSVVLDNKNIEVKVINKRRIGKITLSVKNGKIVITKPCYSSMKSVEKLILSHQSKILQYVDSTSSKIKFSNGEKLLYLGKEYILTIRIVDIEKSDIILENDRIVISVGQDNANEAIYETMYKKLLKDTSEKIVAKKLASFSTITHIDFNSYKVRYMTSRWGSCIPSKGALSFNTKLAMLPDRVVDSIIVHELCHRIEANHQDKFWELVYQYIPDYDECNKWLKTHHQMINL